MSSRVCQARTIGHRDSIPCHWGPGVEKGSLLGEALGSGNNKRHVRFKGALRTHMPRGPKWGPGELECIKTFGEDPILNRGKGQHLL